MERETLTVNEVAELLGCGRNLVYEMAKTGRLPGVLRLGRRIVVSRRAIEKLLEGRPDVGENVVNSGD